MGRQRKIKSTDYTGYEFDHGKVIDEYDVGLWKVACSHCNNVHLYENRSIKNNSHTKKCPKFKPHNWSGLERWDSIIRRTYNISIDEYHNLIQFQGGGCAICGREHEPDGRRLSIDHNHESGEVRGILCYSCNKALGLFYDNPILLEMGIKYLTANPFSEFKYANAR